MQRRPAAIKLLLALSALGLLAYAGHSVLTAGSTASSPVLEDWLFDALLIAATALCLSRAALVADERTAWIVVGLGLGSWSVAELLSTAGMTVTAGFPSFLDVLWLAFYPAAYAGLVLLVRARVTQFYPSLWLDGAVGALATAAVVAAVLFPALLAGTGGGGAAALADLSYPVADTLLLAFVLAVLALTGWRPGRALMLVAVGLALGAFADAFSLWWAATGHSVENTALDWLWPASALTLGCAAWQPSRPAAVIRLGGARLLVPPVLFAATALGVIFYSRAHRIDTAAFTLAGATLAAAIARMAVTFVENIRLAERTAHQAITDSVTGLGNRRLLMRELRETLQIAHPGAPWILVMFDLNGFKRYNDSFGHVAGDALLSRLGDKLGRAVAPHGRAYRLGGDEFCALITGTSLQRAVTVEAAVKALSEEGSGFSVTTSYGTVALPLEANDSTIALQIADERLYRQKRAGGRGEASQTSAVLKQILREREPGLCDHHDGVATMASRVGRRLGLGNDELDRLVRAAELHDVGKLSVPDAILNKPGRLDEFELEIMRQHTVVGERILSAAPAMRPVAEVVRASHERVDGTGYPDGVTGKDIPLAARIIAVCDAFDAMVSDRPYRAPVTPAEALTELYRCSGSQFDLTVVDAFAAELAADPAPTLARLGARIEVPSHD